MPDTTNLPVTDSYPLTGKNIALLAVKLNNSIKWVEQQFAAAGDLLGYLNGDFRQQYGLTGFFTRKNYSRRVFYSNPEAYKTIEFMSIYQSQVLVFRMGAAPDKPNPIPCPTVPLANSAPITSNLLEGLQVLSITIDTTPLMPGDWARQGNTLLLPDGYADKYITVLAQQTAPDKSKTELPGMQVTVEGSMVHFDFSGETGSLYELKKGTSPEEHAAESLFLPTIQAHYNDTLSNTAPVYYWLYASSPNKTVSNPATIVVNPDDWYYS